MKEYWVNVYWPEERIYGLIYDKKSDAEHFGKYNVPNAKYRIRVKMKDKPGFIHSYLYKFSQLKSAPWDQGRLKWWG